MTHSYDFQEFFKAFISNKDRTKIILRKKNQIKTTDHTILELHIAVRTDQIRSDQIPV